MIGPQPSRVAIPFISGGSPPGYDAWLAQASTFGTVTTKERSAVSALFAALNTASIRTKLYQFYVFGGDDAAFANSAARLGKRGINLANPSGTAMSWSGTAVFNNTNISGASGIIGNTQITPASYSFSVSNFGVTHYALDTSSIKYACGYVSPYIFFTSAGTLFDYWGNPPSGASCSDTGVISSILTNGIGTGIRTYRNGSLVGSGTGGAIAFDGLTAMRVFSDSTGTLPYTGRIVCNAQHQAFDATETAAFHAAILAYETAMT